MLSLNIINEYSKISNFSSKFPKYIAEGEYRIDLALLKPKAENYFVAPDCMHIHFEGYYDKYANPLRLAEEGFFGLESE